MTHPANVGKQFHPLSADGDISYKVADGKYGEKLVQAHHSTDGLVGELEIGNFKNVKDIRVAEAHQRKGIATNMWHYAHAQGLNPEHSEQRTDAGDAWARTVGGELPERDEHFI